MALKSGAIFAGYRIIRPLGSGGMGEVYLAGHPRLPRRDALKILPADVCADPEFRERFNREADLAATLFHPNIVGVHDRGEVDGQLWIAMDFVDGPDAAALIRRRYPAGMPREEALATLAAIASALDYAHGRGLLHRDVKPANILLTDGPAEQRRILLADFGIARSLTEISGLTATNMTIGTLSYAAPEQLLDAPLDGRADQYSLAATAFHLLTGSPPYPHSSPAVTIGRHLQSDPPPISAARPDLADWDDPLRIALAKDPAQRFGSCRRFVEALGGGGDDQNAPDRVARAQSPTLAAARPEPPVPAAANQVPAAHPAPAPARGPATSPRRWSLVAAGAALGLLAGAVILGGAQSGSTRDDAAGPRTAGPTSAPPPPVSMEVVTATSTAVTTSTTTLIPKPSTTTVTATVTVSPAPPPPSTAEPPTGGVAAPLPASTGRWDGWTGTRVDPAANLVTALGWQDCIRGYPWPSCLEAARVIAGAPRGATAVLALDGVWAVPRVVGYGDYLAAVGHGGRCSWSGADARGRIVDSGVQSGTGTPVALTVTPTMTTIQSFGCTPWFRSVPAG